MLNKPLPMQKAGLNYTDLCICSDSRELCENMHDNDGDDDEGYDDDDDAEDNDDCDDDKDEDEEEDFYDQVSWKDSESETKFALDTLKHFCTSILLTYQLAISQ